MRVEKPIEQVNVRMPAGSKQFFKITAALSGISQQEILTAAAALLFGKETSDVRETREKMQRILKEHRLSCPFEVASVA